jgi:hypothetical protein
MRSGLRPSPVATAPRRGATPFRPEKDIGMEISDDIRLVDAWFPPSRMPWVQLNIVQITENAQITVQRQWYEDNKDKPLLEIGL